MLAFILILCSLILLYIFPFTRTLLFHPSWIYYLPRDVFFYFKHKIYNNCESGFIDCYCGLFGQGKTVSAVNRITSDYLRYNNKLVWTGNKFERCQIRILSNVELNGIPYTKLESMQQIVDWTSYAPDHRNEWCLALIDEASAILNSRDFQRNLDFFSINALVTCRHYNLGIVLTSQRFLLIDKLAREVCQTVYQCKKIWRVCLHAVYDAYSLENAPNPMEVKPCKWNGILLSDRIFRKYDTLATVGQIKKSCEKGDMLRTKDILAKISPDPVTINQEKKGLFSGLFKK